jgi:hypothetical protein
LILAEIIVFGRETDRDARVEVVATRDDRFPHMRQQWAEV